MNNYTKLEYLGNGSNGNRVYKVKDNKTNQIYAMKIINMVGNCIDFMNEISILKSLNHNNIVKYQDSFKHEDNIIVIMEYVDQGDLNQVIKAKKQKQEHFTEDQIWKWFFELAAAIEYIHSKNILHRDIKVHNAFLNSQGTVKLGDFGISKLLECSIDFSNSTLGTPYYLSPEICLGEKYNLKTDIWMFGCLLYELCTFHKPFLGDSIPAIMYNIKNKTPSPISNKEYSEQLINLIETLMIKNKIERPSIKEVLSVDFIIERQKLLAVNKFVASNNDTENKGSKSNANQNSFSNETFIGLKKESNSSDTLPLVNIVGAGGLRQFPEKKALKILVEDGDTEYDIIKHYKDQSVEVYKKKLMKNTVSI